MTERVLVSACLLGIPVRYDGRVIDRELEILRRWKSEGRVVSVCPEVEGGLGVPRPPAEIEGGDGADVLVGAARVVTDASRDVTDEFSRGARAALAIVIEHDIGVAVLKERSPSCGSGLVYDGSFSGTIVTGDGVTTALLRQHGVQVFGETQLAEADEALRALEQDRQQEDGKLE